MGELAEKLTAEVVENRIGKIASIAAALESHPCKYEDLEKACPVTHRFSPSLYLREIFMPAGTLIVGKVHKTEHFNIILKGTVSVYTIEGAEYHEAPCTFISKAGIQKVVPCHTDCIWQTTHVTNSTDLKEIEAEVIAEGYDQELIESLQRMAIRGDS